MNIIKLALVGKINEAYDSYSKVKEAVENAASYLSVDVELLWIDSNSVNDSNVEAVLKQANGIVLLGGFGNQGTEGMVATTRYARENNVSILGICLGMQIMVIEFARSVLNYKTATSTEFDEQTKYPVIHRIAKQNDNQLRQGGYVVKLEPNSLAASIYNKESIYETFRHGYEFNLDYENAFISNGLSITGRLQDNYGVEVVEIANHPFFIGVQYHPEFQSSINNPHPLFVGLLKKLM